MSDTVLAAVDDEAIQMFIAPAQHSLEADMEIGDGAVATDEQAAPNQRADAT